MYNFWFWFFFGIVILIISTQTITTWYVFNGFSQINNKKLKLFQSIVFCGIISLIIIGSVFNGKRELAIAAAVLEILINFYYYANDFFENGYRNRNRMNSTMKFWRRYWLKMIFGLVIPIIIYVCAELMLELLNK